MPQCKLIIYLLKVVLNLFIICRGCQQVVNLCKILHGMKYKKNQSRQNFTPLLVFWYDHPPMFNRLARVVLNFPFSHCSPSRVCWCTLTFYAFPRIILIPDLLSFLTSILVAYLFCSRKSNLFTPVLPVLLLVMGIWRPMPGDVKY